MVYSSGILEVYQLYVCMYVGHVFLPVRLWLVGVTVVWWR